SLSTPKKRDFEMRCGQTVLIGSPKRKEYQKPIRPTRANRLSCSLDRKRVSRASFHMRDDREFPLRRCAGRGFPPPAYSRRYRRLPSPPIIFVISSILSRGNGGMAKGRMA